VNTDFQILEPEHGKVEIVMRTTMTTAEFRSYQQQVLMSKFGKLPDSISEVLPPPALRETPP